jgi:ATP-binding cassette subfamily C protein
VSYRYKSSENYALRDITLEIEAGSQTAFIGASGSGKSTLADLILGLAKPTSGAILIDGLSPDEWSKSNGPPFGYVPQNPGMISGTIAENITLGLDKSEIDQTRLAKAILDSNLSSVIENLPEGLDTHIGPRKDALSGGQLQRIGLARALYSQPKLLVLDEATSALDANSENEITSALDGMRGRVTVLIIAHRLNTIQRSDVVHLLDQGKIADSGTFSNLLKKNSTVRELAKLMAIETT